MKPKLSFVLRTAVVGIIAASIATPAFAQVGATDTSKSKNGLVSTRFMVRPQTMATGTRNPSWGDYPIDTMPNYVVYVPPVCSGEHRCPLVVFLHGDNEGTRKILQLLRPTANEYGTILLAPRALDSGFGYGDNEPKERAQVDDALLHMLRTLAIDPNKIALAGRYQGGATALLWGGDNLDIFSRVLLFSADPTAAGVDAPNAKTEFYMNDGFAKQSKMYDVTRDLQAKGFLVKHTISVRGDSLEPADVEFAWKWLQETWAQPDAEHRTQPRFLDPLPVLTMDAVKAISKFWAAFEQLPDSIRKATETHQQEVRVLVGTSSVSTFITNMPALAGQYPAVAAAFKTAGITPEEYDKSRIALMSALAAHMNQKEAAMIPPSSVQAKNLAFVDTNWNALYSDQLKVGDSWPIWRTP